MKQRSSASAFRQPAIPPAISEEIALPSFFFIALYFSRAHGLDIHLNIFIYKKGKRELLQRGAM